MFCPSPAYQSSLGNVSLTKPALLLQPDWSKLITGWLTIHPKNHWSWLGLMNFPVDGGFHLSHNLATCVARGYWLCFLFVVEAERNWRELITTTTIITFLFPIFIYWKLLKWSIESKWNSSRPEKSNTQRGQSQWFSFNFISLFRTVAFPYKVLYLSSCARHVMIFTAPKETGIPVHKRLIFPDCLPAFQPKSKEVTEMAM